MVINIDIRTKFGCKPKIWPAMQSDKINSKLYEKEVELTMQWLWFEWQLVIEK